MTSATSGTPAESPGFMGQMTGMVDKILKYPDSFKTATGRKTCRIVFDVAIIAIGVGIFCMMNYHGSWLSTDWFSLHSWSSLADPSISTLMSMPMILGAVGAGISWLIQDIAGKHRRTAAKIAALLLPVLIAGGAACMIGTGFQHGLHATSLNYYTFIGVLAIPLIFFSSAFAIKVLKRKEEGPIEIDGPPSDFTQQWLARDKNKIAAKPRTERKEEALRDKKHSLDVQNRAGHEAKKKVDANRKNASRSLPQLPTDTIDTL